MPQIEGRTSSSWTSWLDFHLVLAAAAQVNVCSVQSRHADWHVDNYAIYLLTKVSQLGNCDNLMPKKVADKSHSSKRGTAGGLWWSDDQRRGKGGFFLWVPQLRCTLPLQLSSFISDPSSCSQEPPHCLLVLSPPSCLQAAVRMAFSPRLCSPLLFLNNFLTKKK